MNSIFRHSLGLLESVIYGPAYAAVQNLIRSPRPLDPDVAWSLATEQFSRVADYLRLHYPPAFARRLLVASKMKQDHLLGISSHYDVSNEFYELFLDRKYMFYSCADFHSDDETLEQAQTNKADFLLNLIDPKAGEKILDLGCGWGAMLKRIFEETGDKSGLHGYTLSQNQVDYNREHHGFNVEFKNFITCDYPENEFDKIYSIGAWEHVRHRDVPMLLDKLYRTLKPGGRIVKHFFPMYATTIPVAVLTAQIFFPGSNMPAYPQQVWAFERAGFRITHQSIHDYRPTLRAWFDNLVANRDAALELVGIRMFNKYMVFFPGAHRFFNDGNAMVVRFVLEKPG